MTVSEEQQQLHNRRSEAKTLSEPNYSTAQRDPLPRHKRLKAHGWSYH
jgi:hypothetical protein